MEPNIRSEVETQAASQVHLITGLVLLVITLIIMLIQYRKFVKEVRINYKLFQAPFINYFFIYTGLILVVVNEIIILSAIIYSNQVYTIFGREKSIFIVGGLGLFIFGWTRIVIFNLSLKGRINTSVRFAFLGTMLFYVFAFTMTLLITFGISSNTNFAGVGYSAAVAIYGTFIIIDLVSLAILAKRKKKISQYQYWIGLLLFFSLFLDLLSIIFNALPLIIIDKVSPDVHVIFNYIVEPAVYLITMTLAFRFLYWVLFNPKWLTDRYIDE
ncbi:MAG: hypothetical protein OEY49_01765 [Candidatus Heimdallarchaeota archaeon]|nr:hypothetical protein [Candidatus Heimdallarchaeota archaeon]